MEHVQTIITNTSYLLTMAGPDRARFGEEMLDNGAVQSGALAIADGVVVETGSSEEIAKKYQADRCIDAGGRLVMPGFVDPHTHLVFAGSREKEMEMRLSGVTYLDILKQGGGIHSTVKATRAVSFEELHAISRKNIQKVLEHGTTTVEIKTGYGLDPDTEDKMLSVIYQLKKDGPLNVIATFLGAHTIPKDIERGEYIDWLTGDALEQFKEKAEFWDVFCEDGAFTLEESEKILQTAKDAGYKLKIHAGQFNDLGATGMAAALGAVSADHLDHVSPEQLKLMKEHGTVAVLLPGVPFYLNPNDYPDVKAFHEAGVPIALATDFNPGSCPSYSMQMMIALACLKMKMSAAEAITAATINAAWAIDRGKRIGSLEPGKQADCIILDVENASQIPYFFGANLVKTVLKKGQVVFNNLK